jgi:hypothetical protein
MILTLTAALDTIEETLSAIRDGRNLPLVPPRLEVVLTHRGWVARITADDQEDSYWGHGPCESSEAAIVGLAEHILEHA